MLINLSLRIYHKYVQNNHNFQIFEHVEHMPSSMFCRCSLILGEPEPAGNSQSCNILFVKTLQAVILQSVDHNKF